MLRVLVTGMSGTGKSTVLRRLAGLGHRVVDTDSDRWSHWIKQPDGSADWIWREDEMTELLREHDSGKLFVAGCKSNQADFYSWFDHIALLTAPADVLLERIAERTTNTYGKSEHERAQILEHIAEIEPLLRGSATVEIDASAPLDYVVSRLDELTRRDADAWSF